MFARKVSVRLKPNALDKFTNLIEHEILPWLRRQKGFLDLITLALPDGSEVATISFWDHEHNAYAYNASGYPQVLEVLEEILDGSPYVKTFEVVGSTIHPLDPARTQTGGHLPQKPPAPQGCHPLETNL
jgi:hypothetical protein